MHGLRIPKLLLVAGILSLFLGGCGMRIASTAERKATLAPFGNSKYGSQAMQRFLTERSGLLVADPFVLLPAKQAAHDPHRLGILGFGASNSVAAAIDSRGYFLTTSHSVGKANQSIAFWKKDRIVIANSRVVWRGSISSREPDLAILHVPYQLDRVFEWASISEARPFVFAAGLESDGVRHRLDHISGRVTRVSRETKRIPVTTAILHNAPLHRGDSGGPLTTSDGQLLGVNVLIRLSILLPKPIGIAERPDLNWLRAVIEKDASLLKASDRD
ncbi:MAG TPA: serine protease [Chthoniobacteraceae bacterium]|nr:serine protease [Chthoniobacteraceae bacterium]